MQIQNIPQLQIGPYQIIPIRTGIFGLDGGAMFGTVPKVLWQKQHPTDESNRIEMQARVLLLKSKTHCVLIDTGMGSDFVEKHGPKLGSKFAEIFAVQGSSSLIDELKKNGIQTNDVTDVILTHLHFDHAGGSTFWDGTKLSSQFKNAQYWIQKANLENAQKPNMREKASYLKPNWQALIDENKLKALDGDQKNLLPNISVEVVNGHTLGQQIVWVEDNENSLVYAADLIPTSSHIRLPWVMGYDLRPLDVIEEKRKILSRAFQKKSYVYFEHDPKVDAATVQELNTESGSDYSVLNYLQIT